MRESRFSSSVIPVTRFCVYETISEKRKEREERLISEDRSLSLGRSRISGPGPRATVLTLEVYDVFPSSTVDDAKDAIRPAILEPPTLAAEAFRDVVGKVFLFTPVGLENSAVWCDEEALLESTLVDVRRDENAGGNVSEPDANE